MSAPPAASPLAGVRPEQGPPLWAPMAFFCTAPLALVAAGMLLVPQAGALSGRWWPRTLAVTHIGTLGFAGSVMLGALYQMLPVIASSPVPLARLSHLVHGTLVAGVAALSWALASDDPLAYALAVPLLACAFVAFLLPVGWALWRAPVRTATVVGMRIAVGGLALLVVLGVALALARRGLLVAWRSRAALYAHLTFGAIVWIGALLAAVSWHVLPMFYLAEEPPRWSRAAIVGCISVTALAALAALLAGAERTAVYAFAAAPGAAAVWLLHPVICIRQLLRRRRRRADESLRFWYAALACGPLAFVLAALAVVDDDPRLPVLLGWCVLWGWAGLAMHGMLTRIIPFLVWFHRYAGLVGKVDVPPMRRMLPPRHARVGLVAHVATLLLGAVAIAFAPQRYALLAGAHGGALVATGVVLASEIGRVLHHLFRRAV